MNSSSPSAKRLSNRYNSILGTLELRMKTVCLTTKSTIIWLSLQKEARMVPIEMKGPLMQLSFLTFPGLWAVA